MDIKKRIEQGEKVLINELDLSIRSQHCLMRMRIETVGQLMSYSRDELVTCRGFGRKSLNEILEMLACNGLRLADNKDKLQDDATPLTVDSLEKLLYAAEADKKEAEQAIKNIAKKIEILLDAKRAIKTQWYDNIDRTKKLKRSLKRAMKIKLPSVDEALLREKYKEVADFIGDGFVDERYIMVFTLLKMNKTTKDIAEIIGVSKSRAYQIITKVMRIMRHPRRQHLWQKVHEQGLCRRILGKGWCPICDEEATP